MAPFYTTARLSCNCTGPPDHWNTFLTLLLGYMQPGLCSCKAHPSAMFLP